MYGEQRQLRDPSTDGESLSRSFESSATTEITRRTGQRPESRLSHRFSPVEIAAPRREQSVDQHSMPTEVDHFQSDD